MERTVNMKRKVDEEGKRIFVKAYMMKEHHDWIVKQANAFGISKSALVNICVSNYKKNCEMVKRAIKEDVK